MEEDELFEAFRSAKLEASRTWNEFMRAHTAFQAAHNAEALAWLKYQTHMERAVPQECGDAG